MAVKAPPKRNKDGTIAKGYNGGGRAPAYVEKAYVRATVNTVKLKDWQEIVEVAMRDAKNGDGKARDWLSHYILGGRPLSASEALSELPPPVIQ